jgi:membrane fusion protein (multidrug efflux system)
MAMQKKVQLGQTIAPNVIVKKGINADDRIIVDGVQSLHTGSLIDISKKPENTKEEKKKEK